MQSVVFEEAERRVNRPQGEKAWREEGGWKEAVAKGKHCLDHWEVPGVEADDISQKCGFGWCYAHVISISGQRNKKERVMWPERATGAEEEALRKTAGAIGRHLEQMNDSCSTREDPSVCASTREDPTYLHTYIPTYQDTYIPRYQDTNITTYQHTYIRTSIHTYIHAHIHTCIHTYKHTHIYT